MARRLGAALGVPVELLPYKNPGALCDALGDWDVGLIGAEPQRAKHIAFTRHYCEIEVTYLVAAGSPRAARARESLYARFGERSFSRRRKKKTRTHQSDQSDTWGLAPYRLTSVAEVDAKGVRVAASRRAAFCLWLEKNLQRATLVQTLEPGLEASAALFEDQRLDALAGLRPFLVRTRRARVCTRAPVFLSASLTRREEQRF